MKDAVTSTVAELGSVSPAGGSSVLSVEAVEATEEEPAALEALEIAVASDVTDEATPAAAESVEAVESAQGSAPVAVVVDVGVAVESAARAQEGAAAQPVLAITLPPHQKHCFACAAVLDMRAELCPRCGLRQLMGAVAAPPAVKLGPRDRHLAAMLAFLLGAFGAHRFYLRQYAIGSVYLLLCWTLAPLVLGMIEGVVCLVLTDEAFDKAYSRAA